MDSPEPDPPASAHAGDLLDHHTLEGVPAANDPIRAVRGIGPNRRRDPGGKPGSRLPRDRCMAGRWNPLQVHNAAYPAALAALPDAPPVLFIRGALDPVDWRAVAIVGTRQPSPTAYDRARIIAGELAQRGWTIVSGLAAGIDTAAHSGALRAGGRTLAVLGSGINVIYPPQNTDLAALVKTTGALLSEVHPDSPPNSPALVARNRMISGLSRVVIVVAAGATSGSLHAARFARVHGRLVYAVESDLDGNQQLIADGARSLPPDFADWDDLSDEIAGVTHACWHLLTNLSQTDNITFLLVKISLTGGFADHVVSPDKPGRV
jgi:DNA processing protein